jgi:ketosteroid isomerase-like protein
MQMREHIEIVQRTADQWNRRAWSELAAALSPDVTVVPPEGWPEGDTVRGFEGWKRQIETLKDSWEEEHVEVVEITPFGDRLLVEYLWTTRGMGSGIPFETPMWCLYAFRGGKVESMRYFMEEARALEAARRPE